MLRLPDLVASPLSVILCVRIFRSATRCGALAADPGTSADHFPHSALRRPTIRAVKKERKHYQLDWTLVQDKARFETWWPAIWQSGWTSSRTCWAATLNCATFAMSTVAKWISCCASAEGHSAGRMQMGDDDIARGLLYMKARFAAADAGRYRPPERRLRDSEGIRVAPALAFLRGLI